MVNNALVPKIAVIDDVRQDTADVKTFRVLSPNGQKPFSHAPGQCAMLSVPGVGEAMFSITSSPTNEDFMEFSVKKCGCVTEQLHQMEKGSMITIRGPYGRPFPVDEDFKGENLLFIAGGIGIAPLRSVINYCRHFRGNYGKIDIVYGARTKDDLVDFKEITEEWAADDSVCVHLTVDRGDEAFCHVGFVPDFVRELKFSPDRIAVLCGPPVMIKFTLSALLDMGFEKNKVYTTMELRMKCGIGKCGRCNIGSKFVCKDGPVFRMDELSELPDEY